MNNKGIEKCLSLLDGEILALKMTVEEATFFNKNNQTLKEKILNSHEVVDCIAKYCLEIDVPISKTCSHLNLKGLVEINTKLFSEDNKK